jgi:hypothetical protein
MSIYLFICGVFYDAVSISDSITSNDKIMVNNEFEKIWKEAVMAKLR